MESATKTKKRLTQELKAAHQRISELEQSEQLLGALCISLPIGMYIVQDRQFQFVSPQFQQITGYSEDELIGTDSLELVFPEDRQMVRENAVKMLKGETFSPYEYRIVTGSGAIKWIMETVASIQYHGRRATLGNFMDISDRKQAEEALRFSDAAFRSIHESVVAIDTEYNITHWNEISEQIYGIPASEAVGKKFLDVIEIIETYAGENAKRFQMLETLGYYQEEQLHRTKHGEVWVDVSIQAIEDKGKRYGWVALATVITQRKQAEEALKQSEEFSSSLLENAPNPVLVVSPDGSIKYVNPAFENLTGFTAAEVTGRKMPYPWWPEESIEEYAAGFEKHVTAGFKRMERVFRKKSGELFWAAISGVPVRHHETLRYFAVNWLDITEPKQAEKSIKKAAEEWRITFDSINDWVSIHDRDFKFVRVNKSLATAFKKDPKEIIGQHCYQLLHGGTGPMPNCPHVKALKTKKPAKEELHLHNPGIYAEISVSPILDDEGEIIGTVHITKDITERKRAEEKLSQLDRMKTEFLSNVSHELRTPLQSIRGFAKLILRGQVPDVETKQEFLQIIDRESQHLGNLIDSLLDMSRLESGRFQINKQPLPLRDTIIDAIKSFHSLARDKNIMLKEDIPSELPDMEVDGERLRQVVINLLSNAIKFSDPGSSITIKAESRNGQFFFQVSDQGIGIPEKAMPHLFERFYRAEDKLARGGAGLGLYISKQIIEAHGGRIQAESKVGKGSTFSFVLPLNGNRGDAHG